jgi:hypothetical protein
MTWTNKRRAIKRHECESCCSVIKIRDEYVSCRFLVEDAWGQDRRIQGVALCLPCAELHEMYLGEPGYAGEPIAQMILDDYQLSDRLFAAFKSSGGRKKIDLYLIRGLDSKIRALCEKILEENPPHVRMIAEKMASYAKKREHILWKLNRLEAASELDMED